MEPGFMRAHSFSSLMTRSMGRICFLAAASSLNSCLSTACGGLCSSALDLELPAGDFLGFFFFPVVPGSLPFLFWPLFPAVFLPAKVHRVARGTSRSECAGAFFALADLGLSALPLAAAFACLGAVPFWAVPSFALVAEAGTCSGCGDSSSTGAESAGGAPFVMGGAYSTTPFSVWLSGSMLLSGSSSLVCCVVQLLIWAVWHRRLRPAPLIMSVWGPPRGAQSAPALQACLRELCYRRSCASEDVVVGLAGVSALRAAWAAVGDSDQLPLTDTCQLYLSCCVDELKLCAEPGAMQQRLDFAVLLGKVIHPGAPVLRAAA
mmetsp:Transcript_12695/g.32107  ORF Transcript_12695/g.32107 Transcript_12695/m.32107 type:complete len:320 (-) Transcript_12695:469-1428(-)